MGIAASNRVRNLAKGLKLSQFDVEIVGLLGVDVALSRDKKNWQKEYNEERPHESLGNMTPIKYLGINDKLKNSNFLLH